MAYFAQLDENGNVIRTVAVNNLVITDAQGIEQEQLGVDFLNNLYGISSTWKKTSYNTKSGIHRNPDTNDISTDQSKAFRKNYGVPGFKYDLDSDSFIQNDASKPYSDWTINTITGRWTAPVDEPSNWIYNGDTSDQLGYSVELQRFLGHFPEKEDSKNKVWFSYNNSTNSWELMDPQPIV